MCRNIKTLFNFDPPATDEEIRAASEQFVRKLSGFNAPSKANEAAFDRAAADRFAQDDGDAAESGRGRGRRPGAGGRTICPQVMRAAIRGAGMSRRHRMD